MDETLKFHLGDTIKKTECFEILAVVEEGGNISQDRAVEILKTAVKEIPSDMSKRPNQ